MTKCGEINYYQTRNSGKIYIPPHRLQQVNKGPFITGSKLYNCLPDHIKEINNFKHFKNDVKVLLLKNCFYSLHEYFTFCKYGKF